MLKVSYISNIDSVKIQFMTNLLTKVSHLFHHTLFFTLVPEITLSIHLFHHYDHEQSFQTLAYAKNHYEKKHVITLLLHCLARIEKYIYEICKSFGSF